MNIRFTIILIWLSLNALEAQLEIIPLANQIPKDQPVVVTFRPELISQKVPYTRIQAYPFVEEQLKAFAKRIIPFNADKLQEVMLHPMTYGAYDSIPIHYTWREFEGQTFAHLFFYTWNPTKLFRQLSNALVQGRVISLGKWTGHTLDNSFMAYQQAIGIVSSVDLERQEDEDQKDYNRRCKAKFRPYLGKVSDLQRSESLGSIPEFMDYEKSQAEVSVWLNLRHLAKMPTSETALWIRLIAKQLDRIYEGNYLALHFYLEQGNIRIEANLHLNDLGNSVAQASEKQKFNKKFFRYVNANKVLEYNSFKLSLSTWLNQWFAQNQEENTNNLSKKVGQLLAILQTVLDEETLSQSLSGDAFFATLGLNDQTSRDTLFAADGIGYNIVDQKRLNPNFVYLLSYQKEESLLPFLGLGMQAGYVSKLDEGYYQLTKALGSYLPKGTQIFFNKGILLISNDEEVLQNKEKGLDKSLWLDKNRQKQLQKSIHTLYYDLATLADRWTVVTPKKVHGFWGILNAYFKNIRLEAKSLDKNTLSYEGSIQLSSEEAPSGNILLELLQSWHDAVK